MSPKTKLLLFTMLIAVVLIILSYYLNFQLGFGFYTNALFSIIIAVLLYALLTRVAEKLRRG